MVPGLIGGFSEAHPKSDIELACHRASKTPGPQNYDPKCQSSVFGGKFNESKPRNFIENDIYLARHNMGPGKYNIPRNFKTPGGTFSNAHPKSDVDWKIFRAKEMPGAGDYEQKSKAFTGRSSFSFMGKPIKGNYQTTIPNAVLNKWSTVQPAPDTCRTDDSVGKQVTSKQRTMPSYSFSGGKAFNMHEDNIVDSIDWASKAESRRAKRQKKKSRRKQEADAMFERFFGYHPSNPRRAPQKPMMRSRRKKKVQKFVSPGPGAYDVSSTVGNRLSKSAAPSYSFSRD